MNVKGAAGTLAVVVYSLSSWIVSYTINFLMDWSSSGTFFLYTSINAFALLFISILGESDVEFSPFARQLTITKAKKLIRRHTKKFRSRKGSIQQKDSLPSSPKETIYESDSSGESSPCEEFRLEYEKQPQ